MYFLHLVPTSPPPPPHDIIAEKGLLELVVAGWVCYVTYLVRVPSEGERPIVQDHVQLLVRVLQLCGEVQRSKLTSM